MLAAIESATLLGVEGRRVLVEVHVSNGLPGFTVVGLPDAACREARDRVRAALLSSGLAWPARRVTVNLAPSGLRKAGSGLDLPIAIGLLVATGELSFHEVEGCAFIGELGLDGSIRTVPGVLPLIAAMMTKAVVVPAGAHAEGALVTGLRVHTAQSLRELVDVLQGRLPWPDHGLMATVCPTKPEGSPTADLADVRGQPVARRALEVAAAGGHHTLFVGPPGAGKTMLAERLVGLLPELSPAQVLETCRVFSAAGLPLPDAARTGRPPFRAPHHGASATSVIGGGTAWMRPGEVSLATNGVLFLDELGEFQPSVLEALREPLEERVVRVARARATVEFPASFLLVAAMNPCPCGGIGAHGQCGCAAHQIERYRRRLSAPLLDRFDLHVPVGRPSTPELFGGEPGERSSVVARRVLAARERSRDRGFPTNAAIPASCLSKVAALSPRARALLERRMDRGDLSARGLGRVRRVARTIDDLADRDGDITAEAAATALEMRAGRQILHGDGRWAA
ncbi:MAG: YifB family Mg chelatase-like AAA ATPase [Acidimicrobiales bacterium]